MASEHCISCGLALACNTQPSVVTPSAQIILCSGMHLIAMLGGIIKKSLIYPDSGFSVPPYS